MVPLLGQPGGPQALPDMDPRVLVAFIEGILRENEDNSDKIDTMYRDAAIGFDRTEPAAATERGAEIAKFLALAAT